MSEDNLEVVSQEMMEELYRAKSNNDVFGLLEELHSGTATRIFPALSRWHSQYNGIDFADYLVASYMVGVDVFEMEDFEAEKLKKWIVRTKKRDTDNCYWYIYENSFHVMEMTWMKTEIFKFNTKEEAEQWTNPQTEVVEVEE